MSIELSWYYAAAIVGGCLLVGGVVTALWLQRGKQYEQALQQQLAEQLQNQRLQAEALQQQVQELERTNQTLEVQLATERTRANQANQHAEEKLKLLQESEQRLQLEFERLANRIFEQKSQQFQQSNQQSLAHTLNPLKQQIESFKQQVAQQFTDETKERASLKQELTQLRDLNKQMADDAEALTKALKGDSKQQGNWGEVVLARMLSQSGLREGHEYDTQSHHRDDDGKSFKPDVIVHLPNDKDVVIDSKVSLTAYERYFNLDDDVARQQALDEHVQSLRTHIKQLGKKNYQQLDGVRTLDYVLMFIPIEPAFLLAVDKDPELISLALDNNIMLVSPTNLLVALRTVHNIWQYEYQSQNAQRIATDAAKLYDKFANFLEDMKKLEGSLNTTHKHFDNAMNKLGSGRGNLISRVEKFRKLGVQPGKRISSDLLLDDNDSDNDSDSDNDNGSD